MQCVQVASVRWKIPCDDANWVYYSTSMAWDDYRLVRVQLHTGILPGPGPASYIPLPVANDTRRSRSRDLGRSLRKASESRINDFAHFR